MHTHSTHINPITAAASSALARDIPGVARYTPHALSRSRSGRDKHANRQEVPDYRARVEIGAVTTGYALGGGAEPDVEFMRHLETVEEVATLEQRWGNSWVTSPRSIDLKPLRIPLHSKKSKRCPSCRHILIKPEQKAQSVRYKIKLVAANYLPAITVSLPHMQAALALLRRSGRTNAEPQDGTMLAGKTYPFQLSFTNPLYDPIQVRLHVQRVLPPMQPNAQSETEKARRPPFAITLPSQPFPIAAFAEAWEYDDDEDMFGLVDDEDDFDGRGAMDTRGKSRTVGVLERRANVTVIGGEVMISKEARGNVMFNMLVSYTYRSDDPEPEEPGTPSRLQAQNRQPEMKTFSFYTVVNLGTIIVRDTSSVDMDS